MNKNKLVITMSIMLMVFSASTFGILYTQKKNSESNNQKLENTTKNKQAKKPQLSKITKVSSKMLFTGNIFWGRYIRDWSMASGLKYAYPFSRLHEFKRDQYDAWITGIECPITDKVNMTSAEQEAKLEFNCRPEFLPEVTKFFDVTTLANNHTDNQGADGFEETKRHLKENDIQYFGHYDYDSKEKSCKVIAMPSQYQFENGRIKKGFLPIAMCGYHGVFGIPTQASIDQIKEYSPYLPVIAMPHMGAEYTPAPDRLKIATYHKIIDAGADTVLADHPHWIQSTEAYKGKLIVYSMGNFMFDQQRNKEVTRSAAIKLNLSNSSDDLEKWYQLGQYCKNQDGQCLDKIKNENLAKLDYKFEFGVVGSDDSGKITKPATPAQTEEILKRLKWNQTIKGLKAPYSAIKD